MNNLIRRTIHPEVRLLDEKQGLVEYVASTETLDSYSEIIRADGWKFDDFQKNAPFVDSHNYNSIDCILGRVVDFTVRNRRLVETVKWAIDVPENVTAQKGFAMTAAGYLKAVSVGFMPVNYVTPFDRNLDDWRKVCEEMKLDPEDTRCRCIYVEQQQKELSACVIGANADAVAIEKSYEAGILSDSDVALFSKRSTKFAQLFEQRNQSSRSYSFAPSPKPNAVAECIKALGGKPTAPPASEPQAPLMKKTEQIPNYDSILMSSKPVLDGMEMARRDGNLTELENAVRRVFESDAREKRSSFGDPVERYLEADPERRYFWNGFARKLGGGLKIDSPEYRALQNMQQRAVSGLNMQDTFGAGLLLAVPIANEVYDLLLHYGAYKYLGLRKMVGQYTLFPKATAFPNAIFITPTQQGKTTIPYDTSLAGMALCPTANTIAAIIQASRAWLDDEKVDLAYVILSKFVQGVAARIDFGAFQGNGQDDQNNGMTKGIFFDPAIASIGAPSGSNTISSLQCISGDDFTLNTYFFVPDGKGWFQLTRGQVILFIDFRSLRILGWALEPRKSYSSLTIRSLCTHILGEFGVPEILYFERGMWKSATLLKGKTDPFDFTEISQGLREFGVKFIHAIRPRTKAVERVGGMFQDIAEAEPGYCGRDERRDAPESLRRQMAEVEARKVHPSKYFYSFNQWNRRLGQLVDQYNTEPQQGHVLAGMSPDQAFEAHMDKNNPPMQFSAGLRYLLAHDKRLARVTLNGVTLQIGKQKFNYRGREIAHLVGREVLAWFDPENPESIVVTNTDRTNPICVARSENPSALESLVAPESGTLGRELARIEGQASYMKTRFNVVKAKFPLPQRQLLAAAQVMELGEQIETRKSAVTARTVESRRRTAANKNKARRLDIPTVLVGDDEQSRRALELLSDAPRRTPGEVEIAEDSKP